MAAPAALGALRAARAARSARAVRPPRRPPRRPRRIPGPGARETAGERRARLAAIPELGGREGQKFSARDALRRAGFERADDLAKTGGLAEDLTKRGSSFIRSDPTLRPYHPASFAELIVFAAVTLLALALLDAALRGRGPAAVERILAGLGTGIRKLFDPRDTLVRAGAAPAFLPPILGTEAYGDLGPRPEEGTRGGGAWGGSKAVVDAITRGLPGLTATSTKRDRRDTASGGVSDHWVGSKTAFARDLGGPVAAMDAAAAVIARLLGIRGYRKGQPLVATVNRAGYRVQVLYRTNVGGNHFDHIHVGARRL